MCFFICLILSLNIIIVLITPIFEVVTNQDEINSIYNKYSKYNIYLLEYTSTTGPSWVVKDSNIDESIGEYIILENTFDPRLLKVNKDFFLDAACSLVVVSNKTKKIIYEGKNADVIKAKKIYIYIDENISNGLFYKKMYIYHMSWYGIIKAFLGIFSFYFRWSL